MMRVFDVFSGIGGMSLGLDRAGFETVGFCEIEPFCNAVLAKHWPGTWRWNDVKTITGELIRDNCGRIDALVGGPPCQPSSLAGKRRGAADDRWLWPDFLRLVSEVGPVWVLAENPRGVLSLRVEGMEFTDWLARELQARGYALLPIELAAEDVGAPQRRERVWFVAYRAFDGQPPESTDAGQSELAGGDYVANASRELRDGRRDSGERWRTEHSNGCSDVADSRSSQRRPPAEGRINEPDRTDAGRQETTGRFELCRWPSRPGEDQQEWEEARVIETQSQMGGSVDGLSVHMVRRRRVAALKALGNAVVPQCAEVLGRAIIEADRRFRYDQLPKIP